MSIVNLINFYKNEGDMELAEAYLFAIDRLKLLEKQLYINTDFSNTTQIYQNIKECKKLSSSLLIELEKREYPF